MHYHFWCAHYTHFMHCQWAHSSDLFTQLFYWVLYKTNEESVFFIRSMVLIFNLLEDNLFHSTRLRLVEREALSFNSWNIAFIAAHSQTFRHYLYIIWFWTNSSQTEPDHASLAIRGGARVCPTVGGGGASLSDNGVITWNLSFFGEI